MSYGIFKKRCLIITDRPIKWKKNVQDVFTLSDMLNGIDKQLNDKKKKEEDKILKKTENIEKEQEIIKNEKKQIQAKMVKLNNTTKELTRNIKKIQNEIKKNKTSKEENIQKQNEIQSMEKMIENANEERYKLDDDLDRLDDNISELENNISEIKENVSNLEMDGEVINGLKSKSIKFNIVIIDNTITNTVLETFRKDFSFDLFMDLKRKYMKKYSILIKPIHLHHDQRKWFRKGVFRFKKDAIYDILSSNVFVNIKNLINEQENIIEFKNENLIQNRKAALEEKLRLAREENYNAKNQRTLEIKVEKIFNVKDYSDFMENRKIFSRFIFERITDKNIKDKLKSADVHEYTKNILLNIDKKYESEIFPYNENNPLNIYYVVFLHNRLKLDPLYEKFETKIANTIGDFGGDPLIKGIVIQSVNMPAIPYYDPVEVFKIYNNDNYFVWMKAEFDKVDGLQIYESHMKKMDMIKNNLHKPKDATKLEQGGSKRKTFKKMPRHSKNKTLSYRS